MQVREQAGRVHRAEIPFAEFRRALADESEPAVARIEQRARFVRRANHFDVEFARPGAARQVRRLVPVICGLVKHQGRASPGQVVHEAIGRLEQRRPVQEMRVRLEVRPVVVEEVQSRPAGVDDEAVVALALECRVGERAHVRDVGRKHQVDRMAHGGGVPVAGERKRRNSAPCGHLAQPALRTHLRRQSPRQEPDPASVAR